LHFKLGADINSDSACYNSAQSLLSSHLPSQNIKIKIYRTTTLSVVLYGCETWSLTLRAEHKLTVFENRVLRRIFEHKTEEGTRRLRKLHNTEPNNLYPSPNIITAIEEYVIGYVKDKGEMEINREF
jgi:hypothetical protein